MLEYYSINIDITHNSEKFYNKKITICGSIGAVDSLIESVFEICKNKGDESYRLDTSYNKISSLEAKEKSISGNIKQITEDIEKELDNLFGVELMEVKMY